MKTVKHKILFGGLTLIVVALGLILWSGTTILLDDLHEGTGAITGLCQHCASGGTDCPGTFPDKCSGVKWPEVPGTCEAPCPDTPGTYCAAGGTETCSTVNAPCGGVDREECKIMGRTYYCDSQDKYEVGCGLRSDCVNY